MEHHMKTTILAGTLAFFLTAGTVAAVAAPGVPGDRFDPNGDGKVTVTELQQKSAERFKRMDANSDGTISKAEIDAAHAQRAERRAHRGGPGGGDRLARLDSDGNGVISLAEFNAGTTHMMQRLDTDKDGEISRDEFASARKGFRGRHHGGAN
jgi:Ca2+-binding EF-hand superfamily protein